MNPYDNTTPGRSHQAAARRPVQQRNPSRRRFIASAGLGVATVVFGPRLLFAEEIGVVRKGLEREAMSNHRYIVAGYLPGYATNKKRGYDIAKAPVDQLSAAKACYRNTGLRSFVRGGGSGEDVMDNYLPKCGPSI